MFQSSFVVLFLSYGIAANLSLSPYVSWEQTGITVAGYSNGTSGTSLDGLDQPFGVSITADDVLYISDMQNNRIVIVDLHSSTTKLLVASGALANPNHLNNPLGLFLTDTSLYVADLGNHAVQKISLSDSNATTILNIFSASFYYLYVCDDNETIYLSDYPNHKIWVYYFSTNSSGVIAGTAGMGSSNSQLNQPCGVYVDRSYIMYIADSSNHRIMQWPTGAAAGVRVAGDGTSGSSSMQLRYPTQLILDTNEYMYISEYGNFRITRWRLNSTFGVCIAACSGTYGNSPTHLFGPESLTFDSNGSLYVSDTWNNRVQKFQILLNQTASYNQPRFSPCALWSINATTLVDKSTLTQQSFNIFVTTNNSIYVVVNNSNGVLMWSADAVTPTRNISTSLTSPCGLFVTSNDDVYVADYVSNNQIIKWTASGVNSTDILTFTSGCYSLFIDNQQNLYCSQDQSHAVVRVSLIYGSYIPTSVAGNGTQGSDSYMLDSPKGIFVDKQFSVYVADCGNNRVQLFQLGYLNGTTVVGYGAAVGTIMLLQPTGVILDADGSLFITDCMNNRIVGPGPNGYQCVAGCFGGGGGGVAASQLGLPQSVAFDSAGNLLVLDAGNARIQKFLLVSNSCDETTAPLLMTSPTTDTEKTTLTTVSGQTVPQPAKSFIPSVCPNSTHIGLGCHFNNSVCDLFQPCQNQASCTNTNMTQSGYTCSCLPAFEGTHCEDQIGPCIPNSCLNAGICNVTSNTTFICQCPAGWQGIHCEHRLDLCENVTCQNSGVCRASLLSFRCECPSESSYSGRYCQIVSKRILLLQTVAKSTASIAILAMASAVSVIVMMDLLKYFFGIDLAEKELEEISQKKQKRRPPTILRFVYVHAEERVSAKTAETVL